MKNYNIDTPERREIFERIRSTGWGKEYYKYRYDWDDRPRRMDEGDYPLDILIEPIWACNLQCPMCPRNDENHHDKRRDKLFDLNIYKRIIDEIAGKVPSIRLAGLGEATLNPNFIEYVKYAKDKGVGEVSLVTNGGTINREYFVEMVRSGLDWISISIDGMDEDYERIRKPLKFNETIERLKMMNEVRKELNSLKPAIQVQGLWSYIYSYAEEYYNKLVDLCDYLQMQSYIDINQVDIDWDEDRYCSDVFRRLFITVDGNVYPCCDFCDESYYQNAIMGNVHNMTIHEIWHGEKLNALRQQQREGKSHQGYCKCCCALRKMYDFTTVEVNGREVVVREYKK